MSHATFKDVLLSMEIEQVESRRRQAPRPVIATVGGKSPAEQGSKGDPSGEISR